MGAFGTAGVPREVHKTGKITGSCDYRRREGRINKRLRIRVE